MDRNEVDARQHRMEQAKLRPSVDDGRPITLVERKRNVTVKTSPKRRLVEKKRSIS